MDSVELVAPLRTYRELRDEIAKLGEPSPGYVRAYRGQTKDFDSMLPTSLRPGAARRNTVWDYCTTAFARELLAPSDPAALSEEDTIAIAQHYGPGTRFLDVTRSLDAALWFALHHACALSADHVVGPEGPADQARDLQLTERWWEYRRWTEEPGGYLYVFDVPKWDDVGSPSHGQLVDLSSRPILSKSSRIQAQAACLLAADPALSGGDLKSFYRRDAILVGWPMEDAPHINVPMHAMFPDPSEDPWYDVFVSMPLTWAVDSTTNNLKLARPLAVTCYRYDAEERTQQICRRAKLIMPNPVYDAAIRENLSIELSTRSSGPRSFGVNDATRIVVETPIVSWFLNSGPEMWNQAILSGDMTDAAQGFDPVRACSAQQRVYGTQPSR
jgi:hypothetical protein